MDARKGLAWRLSNTNTSDLCLGAVEEAVSPDASLEIFNIDRNNSESYHENLNTVAPEDVYYGCRRTILDHRRRIIQRTLAKLRRLIYKQKTAS